MTDFDSVYFTWALILGGLSAVSLPMGSVLGLVWRPGAVITGVMAAFGAGALIAALSIELVAPTVSSILEHGEGSKADFYFLVFGCLFGGILFVLLDQIVNAHGGFLRKTATAIAYFSQRKSARTQQVVEALCSVDILRDVPEEHLQLLVDSVKLVSFQADETIFKQGETGDRLYFIREGNVELVHDGSVLANLGSSDVLGEIALLTGATRTAKAVAKTRVVAFYLLKSDFDYLRSLAPDLDTSARQLASQRLDELKSKSEKRSAQDNTWASNAIEALNQGSEIPTKEEMRDMGEEHGGAPLAIWLGILLDGIPESFVIGAGFIVLLAAKASAGVTDPSFLDVIPYTLIAGLFLSNFPEAMSSSVGMKNQGWGSQKIFWLWFSLMIFTAIGSGLGYLVGATLSHTWLVMIEGLAAGAMLTMIASTMIPEAVHLGGASRTGLSTLVGFLAAICFKLLE